MEKGKGKDYKQIRANPDCSGSSGLTFQIHRIFAADGLAVELSGADAQAAGAADDDFIGGAKLVHGEGGFACGRIPSPGQRGERRVPDSLLLCSADRRSHWESDSGF